MPKSGKFDVWQKIYHTFLILVSAAAIATGVSLFLNAEVLATFGHPWMRWQRLIHDVSAALFLGMILGHLYIRLARLNWPKLRSMFGGTLTRAEFDAATTGAAGDRRRMPCPGKKRTRSTGAKRVPIEERRVMADRDKNLEPEIAANPARRSFFQAAAGTAVAGAGLVGGGYVMRQVAERPSNREIARERPEVRADIDLRVNGKTHRLNVPHQRTLLLALREDLGLTGTKKGCNMAQCGACTVLVGDMPVYSCFMLAADSVGLEITTIESLEKNGTLHPLQRGFIENLGSQCGHCTSGMIMSGLGLLRANPNPSRDEVKLALSGNLCRCGNYENEINAVLSAAGGVASTTGSGEAGRLNWAGMHAPVPGASASPPVAVAKAPGDEQQFRYLDSRMPAIDGYEKATGRARYTGDLGFHPDDEVRNPLFLKVLRSPHAHAELLAIDDSRARALPGYRGLVTWQDIPGLADKEVAARDRQPMNRHARYVGDAVAAVIADNQYIAQEALNLLRVDWRELTAYADAEYNLTHNITAIHGRGTVAGFGGPQPADVPTVENKRGDVVAGFKEADVIVEGRYVTPVHPHAQIEPHVCIASYVDGRLTVWDSQQSVFHARTVLADILRMPEANIRVEAKYVGGGFGGKCLDTDGKTSYEAIAAIASKKVGKPVRYEYTLKEQLYAEDTRNPFIIDIKVGVKRDGTITAIECRAIQPTGGYASSGPPVVGVCGEGIVNTYRCANFWFHGYSVYTNSPVGGEFRGFGQPQAVFAREKHMDEVAAAIGMDPLEFRRKNSKQTGDVMSFAIEEDVILDKIGGEQCLALVAQAIGWERRQDPATKSGRVRRGIGLRYSQEHSGRSDSDGLVWIDREARVHVPTGIGNMGSGPQTGIGLIVAEVLGVPMDRIDVSWADTADVAWDFVTDASRSTHCNGKAFHNAAADLAEQLKATASGLLGVPAGTLTLSDGAVIAGSRRVDFRELVAASASAPARTNFAPRFDAKTDVNPILDEATGKVDKHPAMKLNATTEKMARSLVARGFLVGLGRYVWNPSAQSWGASAAEVEVDMLTGQVTVLKLAAAHDCGRVIFRRGAEAQVLGGTIMGLGYAMTEEIVSDPINHVPLNASLHEIRPPTILDYPRIVSFLVEAPAAAGPFGAKGLGENPFWNAAPAIGNAIFNATGVHMREIPYTWPRVHRALVEAGKAML